MKKLLKDLWGHEDRNFYLKVFLGSLIFTTLTLGPILILLISYVARSGINCLTDEIISPSCSRATTTINFIMLNMALGMVYITRSEWADTFQNIRRWWQERSHDDSA